MKYISQDGREFHSNTHKGLVNKIRQASLFPSSSEEDYMEQVSKRCWEYNGANIRTDTARHFIEDLITHGFLLSLEGEWVSDE